MKNILKTIIEYGLIIAFVIFLRIFIITPIEVNGASMEDTLYDKDVMILNIVGYRLGHINRFDIVVINYGNERLIKRVVGLPGEKVEYKDGKLYINNVLTDESFIDVKTADFSTTQITDDGIIPSNKYFVMGDNRGNSADSRIIGLIDKKDIMGKTNLIIFPFSHFGIVK